MTALLDADTLTPPAAAPPPELPAPPTAADAPGPDDDGPAVRLTEFFYQPQLQGRTARLTVGLGSGERFRRWLREVHDQAAPQAEQLLAEFRAEADALEGAAVRGLVAVAERYRLTLAELAKEREAAEAAIVAAAVTGDAALGLREQLADIDRRAGANKAALQVVEDELRVARAKLDEDLRQLRQRWRERMRAESEARRDAALAGIDLASVEWALRALTAAERVSALVEPAISEPPAHRKTAPSPSATDEPRRRTVTFGGAVAGADVAAPPRPALSVPGAPRP